MFSVSRTIPVLWFGLLGVVATLFVSQGASAQIKRPGAHPDYFIELEPHFVLQYAEESFGDEGIGVGIRATIPVIDNGPIKTINNNLGIGFGFDWTHFDGACRYYFRGPYYYNCDGNQFWFPVVAQWNFFFTDIVGAFVELGLAVQHESYDLDCNGPVPPNLALCDRGGYSDTDVEPLFFVGPRFLFTDHVGLTLRVGFPYLSVGASFLL